MRRFNLPIGVSIYPTDKTPDHLKELGVAEVKFNLEAATPELFATMCPGLDYELLWQVLDRSVGLFGRNRVFSNVIIGLGETDAEMETCIRKLTSHGVIPVLRPLNPVADLAGTPRPSAERLSKIMAIHVQALTEAGLDPGRHTRCAPTAPAATLCPGGTNERHRGSCRCPAPVHGPAVYGAWISQSPTLGSLTRAEW